MSAKDGEIQVVSDSGVIREPSSLRTVLVGSTVVFWILAIFMIHAMNSLRAELQHMRSQLDVMIRISADRNPGQYRVVDPEGRTVYSFERIPDQLFDRLDSAAHETRPLDFDKQQPIDKSE